jgi:hypothetical protein
MARGSIITTLDTPVTVQEILEIAFGVEADYDDRDEVVDATLRDAE